MCKPNTRKQYMEHNLQLGHRENPWIPPQASFNSPFLETLTLSYLSMLMNNPIKHNSTWPLVPHKMLADIPKFNAKPIEDPTTDTTTYNLWCSPNSFMDGSLRLHIFQWTLIGGVSKWYIYFECIAYDKFMSLSYASVNHP